jgi:thiol-disulfide isomerase/thioredoxin
MTDTPHTQTSRPGRISRPALIAVVAAVLAAVVLVGWWLVRGTPWTADAARDNNGIAEPGLTLYAAGDRDPAPPLQGRTLDDTDFNLDNLSGQIVVINVWGSWCGPCRAETPGLVRIANATANQGVQFVGIDTRDDRAAARAFVKNYDVPYPSVSDPTGKALLPFGSVIPSAAIPSSLIVDRDGNVAARVIGAVDDTTLQGLLDDLLEEGPDATGTGDTRDGDAS